jgi:hypothetical protein
MLRVPSACCALLLAGCASLPPGHDYPRGPPLEAAQTANAALLQPFEAARRAHPAESGFRPGRRPRLAWTTETAARTLSTHTEPARSLWQRLQLQLLSLLHVDRER